MVREHQTDGQLPAYNPLDGQFLNVIVRATKADLIRQRKIGPARELNEVVPPVLLNPTAVFRGLRDRGTSNWLCYVGSPTKAYDYRTGQRTEPYLGEVFLVFVNDLRIVYTWGWERSAPDAPNLPEGYATRFDERLKYRDEI